tara:strand:- start:613 stop:1338 length:726 start_codon:yes stop_codon:yes gene_type:complete
MDIKALIAIIAFIVISTIIMRILGKLFKWFFYISTLFSILIAVLGFFVYQDIVDLTQKLPIEEKIILLDNEGTITQGFSLSELSLNDLPEAFDKSEINEINLLYQENKLKEIQDNAYKIIIVKNEYFENVEELDVGSFKVSNIDAMTILSSDAPLDEAVNILSNGNQLIQEQLKSTISNQIGSGSKIKSFLFMALLMKKLQSGGQSEIISAYKEDKVLIYPETIAFKLINYVPETLVEKVI